MKWRRDLGMKTNKKNTLIDTICIIYFMKTVRNELNYDLYLYLENKYHVEKKDNYVWKSWQVVASK